MYIIYNVEYSLKPFINPNKGIKRLDSKLSQPQIITSWERQKAGTFLKTNVLLDKI